MNPLHRLGLRVIDEYVGRTFGEVTVEGLEHLDGLDPGARILFLTNHDDIYREPVLLNDQLAKAGFPLASLVVGRNLYRNPFVLPLLMLQPTFSANRKLGNGRAIGAGIEAALARAPVWSSQGNGRSKDGKHNTNVYHLKNIITAREVSPTAYLAETQLLIAAIGTEIDPTAPLMAAALVERKKGPLHSLLNQVASTFHGLHSSKGGAHIAFTPPIKGSYERFVDLAAAIDRQLWAAYPLFETHLSAYNERSRVGKDERRSAPVTIECLAPLLQEQVLATDEAYRPTLVARYAAPVFQKMCTGAPLTCR